MISPRQFSEHWWREVLKKVKKAVVFIDDEAAECLHWNGGLYELLSAGAVAVKQFSSFERGEPGQRKAVFVTASPLVATSRTVLQDLIRSSQFEYCVLVTAAHPSVHSLARYGASREAVDDMAVLQELEGEMLHWMGNLHYTVEVFYFPLLLASLADRLFLMPPLRTLFPLLESDVPRILTLHRQLKGGLSGSDRPPPPAPAAGLSSLELAQLPPELQGALTQLAAGLHALLAHGQLHEDIFSLGPTAGLLAAALDGLPASNARRKSATGRCSLLLIDRTLDLATACSHGSDALLDRILATLPRLPGHCSDVAVNVSALCSTKVMSAKDNKILAPGCLAHDTEPCPEVLSWLVTGKQKEVLSGLHRLLAAAAPPDPGRPGPGPAARTTPHALERLAGAFRGQPGALAHSCGLLQQALAVAQALRSPRGAQLEQLVSVEKLLFLGLSSNRDPTPVQEQLRRLVQSRSERGLGLAPLLALLLHAYSLAGPDTRLGEPAERELRGALRWALAAGEDRDTFPGLVPEGASEEELEAAADEVMRKLRAVAQARKDLSVYRGLLGAAAAGADLQAAQHTGLLARLLADLVAPHRPALPDLACRGAGLRQLIHSGFSLLLSAGRSGARPAQHPLDSPLLVVFVVGGITAAEARAVQAAVDSAAAADCGDTVQRVLVGSTRLLAPEDAARAVFAHDRLLLSTPTI